MNELEAYECASPAIGKSHPRSGQGVVAGSVPYSAYLGSHHRSRARQHLLPFRDCTEADGLIAEHFQARTPAETAFEEVALPRLATRTSDALRWIQPRAKQSATERNTLNQSSAMIKEMQKGERQKILGQYFTPDRISRLLVSSMERPNPALVLDLGSGRGSLSNAAQQLWRKAQIITVDIDPRLKNVLDTTHGDRRVNRHVLTDGLALDLKDRLALGKRLIGAALCNPPYIRIPHRKDLLRLLQLACLAQDLAERALVPAELLFLAQSLSLLRSGSQVGIVVPDGFACGEQYAALRRSICESHRIPERAAIREQFARRRNAGSAGDHRDQAR